MNDTDTGMIPVSEHIAGGDPLPSDLASPRDDRRGDIVGIVVGAVLLALTGILFAVGVSHLPV